MPMKKSNDTIGNRTRDLPVCSAVSQPTAPPRDPSLNVETKIEKQNGGYEPKDRVSVTNNVYGNVSVPCPVQGVSKVYLSLTDVSIFFKLFL
jgi:hypothetical protein